MKRCDDVTGLTDQELVDFAKRGLDAAFVELFARYRKMAFSMILRILKNWEDAEDVLQDAWIKVYLHIGAFDGRSQFSTWFARVAINSALMALRKSAAHPTESLDESVVEDGYVFRSLVSKTGSPEIHIIELQQFLHLRQAVDRLPSRLREIIALRHSQDASIAEIAASAGISVAAAKSRLMRSRAKLSTIMRRKKNGLTLSPIGGPTETGQQLHIRGTIPTQTTQFQP
jgi:RNA polymerase sigma-70 factor (ECF subfamily)